MFYSCIFLVSVGQKVGNFIQRIKPHQADQMCENRYDVVILTTVKRIYLQLDTPENFIYNWKNRHPGLSCHESLFRSLTLKSITWPFPCHVLHGHIRCSSQQLILTIQAEFLTFRLSLQAGSKPD